MENTEASLNEYKNQLLIVKQNLETTADSNQRKSLLELQSELEQLIALTEESLDVHNDNNKPKDDLDDEYKLFMQEMEQTGAYNGDPNKSETNIQNGDSDIEDELASLLGMKCAVYHTHTWGGQPTLHNAMVSSVVPRQEDDKFSDLQVRVLFTHPTHTEMIPCPYYLNGDCKFDDDQCRYSHGSIVQLSNLKEAIEPNFEGLKVGSRILLKLKAPDEEVKSTAKMSTEKYHLWHRAIVKTIDMEKRCCVAKLEQGVKCGEKRKSISDQQFVHFEEIFPLSNDNDESSDSEDSLSDTEYPSSKMSHSESYQAALVEKSLQHPAPAMGGWEQHTRGMGSKLMMAMGYVPGTGLGATGDGRLEPVEARMVPLGKSLDHCMEISQRAAGQDPLKIEQMMKRRQKKEEERNKRAYEREKERERRNVFNFLNKTIGDSAGTCETSSSTSIDIKQTSSKELNIERFKIEEGSRKIENEISKLKTILAKYPQGSNGHRSVSLQISEKNRELGVLKQQETQINREQKNRKDKQKMTVF
ncbi:zinc finger CCCH-type with G patch domain-containing protein isoform X1 [Leptidea sinapis]|uniref:zinc finger CCCH-type with G patch domain-containing protein isoform X1 n=1 Tax=Leptidea sinapis TaxID=189913 RepID=UPI002132432A|nr:zinc finger CCCH-type with G patch domain-containing protein isoform X1 [Leptidea sinapis]